MALAFTNDELLPKTNNSADYFIKSHFPKRIYITIEGE